jgi:hypothetical protein
VICAAVRACTVTHAGNTLFYMYAPRGNNTKTYRFSGFVTTGGTGNIVQISSENGGAAGQIRGFRFDHNTVTMAANTTAIQVGGGRFALSVFGVIDSNIFTGPVNFMVFKAFGPALEDFVVDRHPYDAGLLGTANNLFFEDNVIDFTTNVNLGNGCIDVWMAGSVVVRNNKSTNCLWTAHGTSHVGGSFNFEFYRNTVSRTANSGGLEAGQRLFHHQGSGEIMLWGNTYAAPSGVPLAGNPQELTHYRTGPPLETMGQDLGPGWRCDGGTSDFPDGTGAFGYPCWMQPGRAAASSGPGTLSPIYTFMNVDATTGNHVNLYVNRQWSTGGEPYVDVHHVVVNRDYYTAVSKDAQTSPTSPFNGTVGMGFGTLANRPTTCTTNPNEPGGGVGYWATDQGEWDSTHAGPDGRLYRCSETNVWTVHYTPYTYPHPLRTP